MTIVDYRSFQGAAGDEVMGWRGRRLNRRRRLGGAGGAEAESREEEEAGRRLSRVRRRPGRGGQARKRTTGGEGLEEDEDRRVARSPFRATRRATGGSNEHSCLKSQLQRVKPGANSPGFEQQRGPGPLGPERHLHVLLPADLSPRPAHG
jgi:hypothetical protein